MTFGRSSGTDVAVIGGGIIGAACAHALAQAGFAVQLLEQRGLATGTSKACQGGIGIGLDMFGEELAWYRTADEMYRRLAADGADIDYVPSGEIIVTAPRDIECLRSRVDRARSRGLDCRWIDSAELRDAEPRLAMDIEGAALLPGVAHVSPMKVVRELVVRSVAMGAEVWPATEVTGIDVEGERIRGVTTNRGFLAAAWVVVAAGVWSTKVCAGLGLNLPIRPLKGNVLVTEPVGAFVQHYVAESRLEPIGGQPESGLDVEREGESAAELVMQNLPSGSILIGSTKQHHAADLDVDRVSVAAIAERALRFFPSLRQVRILRTYSGWRPWVPDGHPIIGPVAGVGGLIVAAGHAGNGNTWALLTGALVADMISGRPSAVAVSALSPNRFASTGQ